MTTATLEHGHYDPERWLSACLAAFDGYVTASAEMAQAAAERAFGRRFTIHPFRPLEHFTACLLTPDRRTVTGGQAWGEWAIVPLAEVGSWTLQPVLFRWMGAAIGSPGWIRIAAFKDAETARAAIRPLTLAGRAEGTAAPTWVKPDGLADLGATERVLLAAGMMPGRIGPSPLRVYAWRR